MAVYREIHIRRDSTLNWYASNPRLALGEPGVDMDLHRFKIGNGIDRWNQLPYMDDDLYRLLDKNQQEAADKAQELLNQIRANKLDADTKHNTLTTEVRNTSRDLNARMTAVETEQVEYEEKVTSRQTNYEDALTGDFEDTKAEVHAGLEEFNETRDKLNIRMDAIAGQATEDTEILDARVDAEYQTHPNLGANIRNIHAELLSAQENIIVLAQTDREHEAKHAGLSDNIEKLTEHDEYLQEQIDTSADAILMMNYLLSGEIDRAREVSKQLSEQISEGLSEERREREKADERLSKLHSEREEYLQEQADETAGSILSEMLSRRKDKEYLQQKIRESRTSNAERGDYLQEQIDEAAEAIQNINVSSWRNVQKLKSANEELNEELNTKIERASSEARKELEEKTASSRESLSVRAEHIQEQIDEEAGAILRMGLLRLEDKTEEAKDLKREEAQRTEEAEHIQEQVDENALTLLKTMHGQYMMKDRLKEWLLHEKKAREGDDIRLQEQTDETAEAVLNLGVNVYEESEKRRKADRAEKSEREEQAANIQTQIASLTEGVMNNALTVSELNASRKRQLKRETENRTERDEILQEEIAALAEAELQHGVNLYEEAEKRRALGQAIAGLKSPVDWSKAESLAIPEPRCAIVNFTGITSMPTSKTVDIPAVLEFWDMQGNYFRKNILCSAQGSSSLGYVKKNVKVDLLNEDGSEFDLKIGNWVAQDGFHLKAYYTDFFRGVGVTSYKFWDEIMRYNGLDKDRPYKRAMINASEIQTSGTSLNNSDDMTLQFDTGALCHPDAFPCIVYLNGEFYGVYSWQLKKQRKNYRMDKSTVEHIHLDGTLSTANFWNGTINWPAFEIRNPNKLYTMDGKKYDGDAPKELIDETSEKYNPDNKDHVRSAKVKRYIQDFVRRFGELKASPTREKYEALFDWENQRDYLIFSDIIKNSDGFAKNWQWTTYDGVKWYVNAYDLDMSYGGHWQGTQITAPLTGHITTSTALPTGYVALLYNSELEARYKELRDAGIISVNNILSKLADWTARIGISNYELEFERWPNSPCILNYTDSIYRVKRWLEVEIANMDKVYNYSPAAKPEKLIAELSENVRNVHEADVERLDTSDNTAAKIRYDDDRGLKSQIDELSYLVFKLILMHDTERKNLDARLKVIEEALIDGGLLDESDIPPASDTDIYSMIDDVFAGKDTEEPAPVDDDDAELYEDLDKIFNP